MLKLSSSKHQLFPLTLVSCCLCVSASAAHPAAAANGSSGHYGNGDEEWDDGFPPPPSPHSVEKMDRDLPLTPPQQRYSPAYQ